MPSIKIRIQTNLQHVREQIAEACRRAGRSPQEVTVIAVTKSADLDGIKAAIDLGLSDLGESRVQQFVERAAEVAAWQDSGKVGAVRWHMIGHLQRNKIKAVLQTPCIIHSVDSLRTAEDISQRAQAVDKTVDVLIQVNASQEQQKFGCAVGAAPHLAEMVSTMKNLRLVGLMTMARQSDTPQEARPTFALVRELFDELRHNHVGGDSFRHLSMGMSQDFAVAVEEGSTMVRIGTALFQ